MRSRPLFVRHSAARTYRRALRRARKRSGLLGPLALAVTLAVAGHEAGAPAGPRAGAVPAAPVGGTDVPERAAPVAVPAPTATRANAVSRQAPPRPVAQRASRSRTRAARVAPAWVRPAHGPLTSHFGYRWGKLHKGIDIGAPWGSPIYAASDGVVTYAGPRNGYGRLVTIRHAGGFVTAYGHMSRFAVHAGQHVTAGQVIAYVGSAGHSTGPHLHFEVRVGGSWIDPLPFLRARGIFN